MISIIICNLYGADDVILNGRRYRAKPRIISSVDWEVIYHTYALSIILETRAYYNHHSCESEFMWRSDNASMCVRFAKYFSFPYG